MISLSSDRFIMWEPHQAKSSWSKIFIKWEFHQATRSYDTWSYSDWSYDDWSNDTPIIQWLIKWYLDYLITWSCDELTIWSFDPILWCVIHHWSLIDLILWLSDPLIVWFFAHSILCSFDWSPNHLETWLDLAICVMIIWLCSWVRTCCIFPDDTKLPSMGIYFIIISNFGYYFLFYNFFNFWLFF